MVLYYIVHVTALYSALITGAWYYLLPFNGPWYHKIGVWYWYYKYTGHTVLNSDSFTDSNELHYFCGLHYGEGINANCAYLSTRFLSKHY